MNTADLLIDSKSDTKESLPSIVTPEKSIKSGYAENTAKKSKAAPKPSREYKQFLGSVS